MAYAYNPSIQEVETGGSRVRGLHLKQRQHFNSEFEEEILKTQKPSSSEHFKNKNGSRNAQW